MKLTLNNQLELIKLSRNEKLFANSIYIISSESAAQNLYFENKTNLIYAHKKIKEHMVGVMEILNYLFTPHGWLMLVKTREETKIIEYYARRRKKKKNLIESAIKTKDSEIISEQIRYAISAIALRVNTQIGRSGSLVHGNYSRFLVKDLQSAKNIIKKMRNEEIELCSQSQRYRGNMEKWNKNSELEGKGDIFLCTLNMARKEKGEDGRFFMQTLDIKGYKDHVLHKIIEMTIKTHNIIFSRPNSSEINPDPPS